MEHFEPIDTRTGEPWTGLNPGASMNSNGDLNPAGEGDFVWNIGKGGSGNTSSSGVNPYKDGDLLYSGYDNTAPWNLGGKYGNGNNSGNGDGDGLLIPGVNYFPNDKGNNNSSPTGDGNSNWADVDKRLIEEDEALIKWNKELGDKKEALKNNEIADNEAYKEDYIKRQEDYYNQQNALLERARREQEELDRQQEVKYNERISRDTKLLEDKKNSDLELLTAERERAKAKNEQALKQAEIDTEIERVRSAWAYQKLGLGFSSGIINTSQQIAQEGIQKLAQLRVEANFQDVQFKHKAKELEFNYTKMINDNIDLYTDKIDGLKREAKKRIVETTKSLLQNNYEKNQKIEDIKKWAKDERHRLERQHLNDINEIKKDNVNYTRMLQQDVDNFRLKEAKKVEDAVNTGLITRMSAQEIAQKEMELGLPSGSIMAKYNNYIDKGLHNKLNELLDGNAKDVDYGTLRERVKKYQQLGYGYEGAVDQVVREAIQEKPEWKKYSADKEEIKKAELEFKKDELSYKREALKNNNELLKRGGGLKALGEGYFEKANGEVIQLYNKHNYTQIGDVIMDKNTGKPIYRIEYGDEGESNLVNMDGSSIYKVTGGKPGYEKASIPTGANVSGNGNSGRVTQTYGTKSPLGIDNVKLANGQVGTPGIDIAGKLGSPITATIGGIVKRVVNGLVRGDKGLGNQVVIEDEKGNLHTYGHLKEGTVKPGQKVVAGQQIGTMGNSGQTVGKNGIHLDYRVKNKKLGWIDPGTFILGMLPKGKNKTEETQEYWNKSEADKPEYSKKENEIAYLENELGKIDKEWAMKNGWKGYKQSGKLSKFIENAKKNINNKIKNLKGEVSKLEKSAKEDYRNFILTNEYQDYVNNRDYFANNIDKGYTQKSLNDLNKSLDGIGLTGRRKAEQFLADSRIARIVNYTWEIEKGKNNNVFVRYGGAKKEIAHPHSYKGKTRAEVGGVMIKYMNGEISEGRAKEDIGKIIGNEVYKIDKKNGRIEYIKGNTNEDIRIMGNGVNFENIVGYTYDDIKEYLKNPAHYKRMVDEINIDFLSAEKELEIEDNKQIRKAKIKKQYK